MGADGALIKGTLDLLILKVLSLEPMHGWGIAQRIQAMSGEALLVQQGSLSPRCTVWPARAGSPRRGATPTWAAAPASTR